MTKIPKFKNEREEAEFWSTHDTTPFLDEMEEVTNVKFPKPTHKSVVVDLNTKELETIKKLANRKHLPFHTLIQRWIKERISGELKTAK